jgi:hypothetical protein
MRRRNNGAPEGGRWQGDIVVAWTIVVEFAFLVLTTIVLITLFPGSGFWPWLVLAAAIVVGWLAAVVILIPRSAPRR